MRQLETSSAWGALGRSQIARAGLHSGQQLQEPPPPWHSWALGKAEVTQGGEQDRGIPGMLSQGHLVCATRLRSLASSANRG